MHLRTDTLELLDHEPPARRRLQRDLETVVSEPPEERADRVSIGRRDPGARDLTGDRLDPLSCDLRTMLIQSHHDRHRATSSTAGTTTTRLAAALQGAHRIP